MATFQQQQQATNPTAFERVIKVFEQDNIGLTEHQKAEKMRELLNYVNQKYAAPRRRVNSASGVMASHMGFDTQASQLQRQLTVPGMTAHTVETTIDPFLLDLTLEQILNRSNFAQNEADSLDGIGQTPESYLQSNHVSMPDAFSPASLFPTGYTQSMKIPSEYSNSSRSTPASFTWSAVNDNTFSRSGNSMYPPSMTHNPSGSTADSEFEYGGLNLMAGDSNTRSIYDIDGPYSAAYGQADVAMFTDCFPDVYGKPEEDFAATFANTAGSFDSMEESIMTVRHGSVPMSRDHSSASTRSVERLRQTTQNLSPIRPRGGEDYSNIILTKPNPSGRQTRKKIRAQCQVCFKEFVGKHEAVRHYRSQHADLWEMENPDTSTEVWVVTDERQQNKDFLGDCKSCRSGHEYREKYNCAAHLRRAHFNRGERPPKGSRGGAKSGHLPPMDVCEEWMKKIVRD